jgi:hypothetical protein
MKLWQQWLGTRIAELKTARPDTTYERIGQLIRQELREQSNLEPTERAVLNQLEDKVPGRLGPFIGTVYRTYKKK